jgi:DNA-binding CsgD family transcriptional regulator/tetratricopeptide (TPR) repeat protein
MRGRERELKTAGEFLRNAQRGRASVLLVEGEPGMGKSAILDEVARLAREQGFSLAVAAADELGRLMQFAPLAAAFQETGGLTGPAPRSGTPALGLGTVDEIGTRIERRASAGPVLIGLDDLHWADSATLTALRVLPQRLAALPVAWILVRCTVRDRDRVGVLFDLLEGEGAVRITLGPIDDDAVAGVLTDALGAAPGQELQALASGAAGNPYLLAELLRGLREENAVRVAGQTASLVSPTMPERMHAVMRRRLGSLSGRTRYLLETMAVLGPSFRFDDAAEMLGETPAVLLPLVDEALAAGILAADAEAFTFRHRLIWRAITETVPPPARQALHRQFAGLLMARGGFTMTAARHLLEGARRGDVAALAGLDRAAEEIRPTSPQTAADLTVRALDLTLPDDQARLARTARAAGALAGAGRADEAAGIVERAMAGPLPPPYDAQLRCTLSSILCLQGEAGQASAEAETVLAQPDLSGPLREEAVVAELQALAALGENQRARSLAEDVLAHPGEHGEPALAGALSVLAAACWDDGLLGQGLRLCREAAERSPGISPDARHFQPLLALAARLIDLRQLDEASAIIRAAADAIRAVQGHGSEAIPAVLRARVNLAMGRTEDARTEAEAALSIADTLGARPHRSLALSVLSMIALRRGDLQAAGLHMRNRPGTMHAVEGYARTETVLARAQFVEAAAGAKTAMQVLGGVYDGLPVHRHVLIGEPTASAWLARTALAAGRRELAAGVARVADEIAGDNPALEIATVAAAHCGGIVRRDPARLAHAAARHPDPWARASASEDLGSILATTTKPADAVAHLDNALAGYGQTGAARDLARVRRRLRRLGIRRRHWTSADRPAVGWTSLTPPEQTASNLVAQGLSNQQVAEQMYVSVHTVAFHLRQVFRKLGISSRVELARIVAEQASGPADPPPGRPRWPAGPGVRPDRDRSRERLSGLGHGRGRRREREDLRQPGQLDDHPHLLGHCDQPQPAVPLHGPPPGQDQRGQARAVHEGNAAQVEQQPRVPLAHYPQQMFLQRPGRPHVDLARQLHDRAVVAGVEVQLQAGDDD